MLRRGLTGELAGWGSGQVDLGKEAGGHGGGAEWRQNDAYENQTTISSCSNFSMTVQICTSFQTAA